MNRAYTRSKESCNPADQVHISKGADRLDEESALVKHEVKESALCWTKCLWAILLPALWHLIPVTSSLCLLCFTVFTAEKKHSVCQALRLMPSYLHKQSLFISASAQHVTCQVWISVSIERHGWEKVFLVTEFPIEGDTASVLGRTNKPNQSHFVHKRWWLWFVYLSLWNSLDFCRGRWRQMLLF